MKKNAAYYNWLNQFLPFYRTSTLLRGEDPTREYPYGTYEYVADTWDGGATNYTPMVISLWYRTESEAEPDAKVQEISEAIGLGGALVGCDDGYLWIKRGSPFSTSLYDEKDPTIKRRSINLNVSFLTKD